MKVEDLIRAKHAFEDRVREFLDMASVMSDREIEIALARLADALPRQSDAERMQALFKGKLLTTYLTLRKSGEKNHRKLRRLFGPEWKTLPKWGGRERLEEYLLRCAAEASVIPEGVTMENREEADMTQTVKLLAP